MDLARHCNLCDHQKTSLKKGTTCGLTDRKTAFNKTCAKITLNDKFENKLKSVNIDYQNIKRKKTLTYIYFVVFLTTGIAVIVFAPFIILPISVVIIGLAFGILIKHRRELEVAKSKKDNIDGVLNLYRIEYDIDIKFGKEIHGNQEVYVELKTKGIR